MNNETFDIKQFTDEEITERKFPPGSWTLLATDEANELLGMNRKQRRVWLSQQRKAGNK
jgi:hypothetical protein